MKSIVSPTHSRAAAHPPLQVLDPCTLGRPTHLLGGLCAQLKLDLVEHFRREFNRRYRASFEVSEVVLRRQAVPALPSCWQVRADAVGRIGFGLDRGLLLCILGYRYGEAAMPVIDRDTPVRETAAEERLVSKLAVRFIDLLTARIDAMPGSPLAAPAHDFALAADARPGAWVLRVDVTELARAVRGSLWFTLDEAWMSRLLRRLAPVRASAKEVTSPLEPLASRLQFPLVARLLQQEMLLGDLMRLRTGDVLPIRLASADVLVDDARLFTAAVVEHRGKLCLTSFEPIERPCP